MYAIILGGGEVGCHLSRELIGMGHEVLLIEKDAKKCEHLREELGSVSLCGDGCEMSVLTKAGIARADMFIAVTDEDDDNLAASQIARQKFQVAQVIAKINNPRNERIFAKLGIEHTVSAARLILESIKAQTPIFPMIRLLNFGDAGAELVLVRIEGDSLIGRTVGDLVSPAGATASLLIREGCESHIPALDTPLQVGDQVVCLVPIGGEEALRAAVGG